MKAIGEFQALRVYEKDGGVEARFERLKLDDLTPGEVVIRSAYSSINYKDALAVTGKGKILKKMPLNPGIDVSGVVVHSDDPNFREGDEVLVTGCNTGEVHDGGYSEIVRVPANSVVPLPKGLTLWEAMAFGTAGFTAALCLHRLQVNDQTPDKGPIVVTGASGGVGAMAITMLAKSGFDVIAVSGKESLHGWLKELGAKEVVKPEDLALGTRPLEKVRFGGAIDNVGGEMLSGLMRHVQLWGNIACVGLALDARFDATVMPLILRGVSLLGISSNNTPMPLRRKLWERLAGDLKPKSLEALVDRTVPLTEVPAVCEAMIARKTHARTVVKLGA